MHRLHSTYRAVIAYAIAVVGLTSCQSDMQDELGDVGASIINGRDAKPGAWPWMVALYIQPSDGSEPSQVCGGTLLNPWWVVTAAHCLMDGEPLGVRMTSSKLSEAGPFVPVTQIVGHPGFGVSSDHPQLNDIALLRLETPIYIRQYPPLISPQEEKALAPSGTLAWVIGWGATHEKNDGEESPDALQELQVPIGTESDCENYARTRDGRTYRAGLMMCAGFLYRDASPCYGDSGGPLFVVDDSGLPHLVGITSWGEGCGGVDGYLEAFTRVSAYRTWISGVFQLFSAPHPIAQ